MTNGSRYDIGHRSAGSRQWRAAGSVSLALCLLSWACSQPPAAPADSEPIFSPTGEVRFRVAQPVGQKSTYAIKNSGQMELTNQHLPDANGNHAVMMEAVLETEVLSKEADGRWTLLNKFANVQVKLDGETNPQAEQLMKGKSFTVVFDQSGKAVEVKGFEELGLGTDASLLLSQMNLTRILPTEPVKVGNHWPIEFSQTINSPQGKLTQTITGKGLLKEIGNQLATIDIDLKLILAPQSAAQEVISNGTIKSLVVYDLEKARIVSDKSNLLMETNAQQMKTVFRNQSEMTLVNP